ncbi:chromate transporter [Pseudomonas hunanensis]|uniref:Chromate transporter n=1 Tax=Pseudomonas hunanensis TaxID=1247546 RepID=A0ACC6K228_9PSED|nr:chromate efflux transporter [Pseudomonas hunanensis]MDR6712467.1 chromate transporter [Pseudomonas hunanensis]
MSERSKSGVKPCDSAWSVFLVFLRLGLTSFGGPIAHLGYFREAFVARRQWLSERSYAELVALCQLLPGPASSQVGIALGLSRAGFAGAVAAWAGFTLPSALILVLCAQGLATWGDATPSGLLHGLKIVAVAVVAQAVWGMARSLCTDAARVTIALLAACTALLWPNAIGQIAVMVGSAIAGLMLPQQPRSPAGEGLPFSVSRKAGLAALVLFFVLLVGLPLLTRIWPSPALAMVNAFYSAGSLVFGGGHVVLPLLESATVPTGWVATNTFLAGYGLAQAVPGPLFTFAAFLGASMSVQPSGWVGATVGILAIFTPSFLLVIGVLPLWGKLRHSARSQSALAGVNAGVVGLLLAALYQPVWTSAIVKPADFAWALIALMALMFWRMPPWLVVLGCGLFGWLLNPTQTSG